ncbi:MAG: protein translocase subunit SecD [Candidatus Rokubacteria bacterium]|nr:protein translocase subunit SecD [Candidatus Rokubacteria bacterium]
MPRAVWLRVALVVLVMLGSIWSLYPIRDSLNLGLDLQGGVHLVLGVEVDKHVATQTERAAEDLKAALERKGIAVKRVAREGQSGFVVELANPGQWNDALTVAGELGGFERQQEDRAAGRFVMAMSERQVVQIQTDAATQVLERLRNRVDKFGVAEPTIAPQGTDRILIQLPGVQDVERAKSLIGQTGLLEFKLVERFVDEGAGLEAIQRELRPDQEVLPRRIVNKETRQERLVPYVVVRRRPLLTGAALAEARIENDPNSIGNWQVGVTFNATGGQRFAEITEQHVKRNLAIVLDGVVTSAPEIRERIPSGRAVITGQFTVEQAQDLKIVLNEGALPASVKTLEERTVGPSLGADSIRQGMIAILASAALVFVFMLVYYRLSGVIADVGLILNLLILLGSMAAFGATLTLPGIAGIALTIGMAVDTNILIFERIREELRVGKTPRGAIDAGFSRAFRTIIDTHVTVLVTAAILYNFGTGPVKGFAVSLFVGLAASLFTAVFFTRLLFDVIYVGRRKVQAISI